MVHVTDVKAETLRKVIEEHVADDVQVILTDDFKSYPLALKKYEYKHFTINLHSCPSKHSPILPVMRDGFG
jgi:transposase-like protein